MVTDCWSRFAERHPRVSLSLRYAGYAYLTAAAVFMIFTLVVAFYLLGTR